ncbi:T9SS type A sorting domain-containing protein [bacterium]|nr:T9SS type A sorting domain-containing protein [bacterium]
MQQNLTLPIYRLSHGDGSNDGFIKLYAACDDGHIYQLKKSETWIKTDIGGVSSAMYGVAVEDGNNDGEMEVYGACSDGQIYQFKYNGTLWVKTTVGSGSGTMHSVAVADANLDGQREVYGACADGKIYRFHWVVSNWESEEIGSVGSIVYDLLVNDAENIEQDAIYAACSDGHVYQYKWSNNQWNKEDLGSAPAPLLRITAGDGDNDNQFEIYAVAGNNHVYQFKAGYLQPTPTATRTPIPDFDGRIISKKYIYAAPNPIRGHIANIVIFTNTPAEVSGKLFTTSNQEVLSFRRNYGVGKHTERINMSNLANGVYLLLIKAKNNDGVEERVIKKIALIK